MKIVVLVKSVPDPQFDGSFTGDNTVDRADAILNELDEYAIEAVLSFAGESDETIALTMGPEKAGNAVKKALQMGVDAGFHVSDGKLAGADAYVTAQVLAATIKNIGDVDVVVTGMASTDAETSIVPSMLAEILDWPQLTMVSEVEINGEKVEAVRASEKVSEKLEATLPAVISVTDQANTPRYPNFKGILAAKKKEIGKLSLGDLDVESTDSLTEVVDVEQKPEREQGTIITDKGDGASVEQLVDFLEKKDVL